MRRRHTYYVTLTRANARDPFYAVGPVDWQTANAMLRGFTAAGSPPWLPPDVRSRTDVVRLARWAARNEIDVYVIPALLLNDWTYDALLQAVDITRDVAGLQSVRSLADVPALERREEMNDA